MRQQEKDSPTNRGEGGDAATAQAEATSTTSASSEHEYLTYDELEAGYRIKKGTAYGKVQRREIPHVRLGPRTVLFPRAEIEAWMRAQIVRAQSRPGRGGSR